MYTSEIEFENRFHSRFHIKIPPPIKRTGIHHYQSDMNKKKGNHYKANKRKAMMKRSWSSDKLLSKFSLAGSSSFLSTFYKLTKGSNKSHSCEFNGTKSSNVIPTDDDLTNEQLQSDKISRKRSFDFPNNVATIRTSRSYNVTDLDQDMSTLRRSCGSINVYSEAQTNELTSMSKSQNNLKFVDPPVISISNKPLYSTENLANKIEMGQRPQTIGAESPDDSFEYSYEEMWLSNKLNTVDNKMNNLLPNHKMNLINSGNYHVNGTSISNQNKDLYFSREDPPKPPPRNKKTTLSSKECFSKTIPTINIIPECINVVDNAVDFELSEQKIEKEPTPIIPPKAPKRKLKRGLAKKIKMRTNEAEKEIIESNKIDHKKSITESTLFDLNSNEIAYVSQSDLLNEIRFKLSNLNPKDSNLGLDVTDVSSCDIIDQVNNNITKSHSTFSVIKSDINDIKAKNKEIMKNNILLITDKTENEKKISPELIDVIETNPITFNKPKPKPPPPKLLPPSTKPKVKTKAKSGVQQKIACFNQLNM